MSSLGDPQTDDGSSHRGTHCLSSSALGQSTHSHVRRAEEMPPSNPPFEVSRILMKRYDRQQIYRLVWSVGTGQAGRQLGMGENIWAVCKALHIPCPPRGFRQKLNALKPVDPAPPLPPVRITETGAVFDLDVSSPVPSQFHPSRRSMKPVILCFTRSPARWLRT
jgi:hypothetical protein